MTSRRTNNHRTRNHRHFRTPSSVLASISRKALSQSPRHRHCSETTAESPTRRGSLGQGQSSLALEQLTPRVLMNASSEWVDPVDISDKVVPGYGTPDAFFADLATWEMLDGYDPVTGLVRDDYDTGDTAAMGPLFQAAPLGETASDDFIEGTLGLEPDENPPAEPLGPAQPSVLFLDFDGGTVTNRPGDFYLGMSSVTIPAYDLGVFGWGGQEQQSIEYIADFVAEDYAAYNVQVTTQQPSSGDYTTIYVGGTNDWFKPNGTVIGVATYDIGNRYASNFGFAFTEELGIYKDYSNGSVLRFSEYVSNLVSHEAAHTYGSNHISDTSALMNPYLPLSPRTSMFGNGSKPGSGEAHDTQAILGTNIGYYSGQPDDHGDGASTATTLTGSATVDAALERRDDVDAFRWTPSSSGNMTINIETPEIAGNLDSVLRVYRNNGSQFVAENDDYNGDYDSTVSLQASAGESYLIVVESSGGNSSGSYQLSLETGSPQANLVVSDSIGSSNDQQLTFNTTNLYTTQTAQLQLENTGNTNLVISRLTLSGSDDFVLNTTSLPGLDGDDITVAPGEQQVIQVTFSPDDPGLHQAIVTIESNDPTEPSVQVALQGQANEPEPDIELSADGEAITNSLDFGDIAVDATESRTLRIHNDGLVPLIINDVDLDTNDAFTLGSGVNGNSIIVAPGSYHDVAIEVEGISRGDMTGTLELSSNDPDESPRTVELNARIVAGELGVFDESLGQSLDTVDFGTVYVGQQVGRSIILRNTGDDDLALEQLAIDGPFQLLSGLNALSQELGPLGYGPAQSILGQGEQDTLAPGETMPLTLVCAPTQIGQASGQLTIETNGIDEETIVSVSATAEEGVLAINEADGTNDGSIVTAESIRAGGSETIPVFSVTNHGNTPLTLALAVQNSEAFSLTSGSSLTVEPGQDSTIGLTVKAGYTGSLTGTITLQANDPQSTTTTVQVSTEAYARISSGEFYNFTDSDGDRVMVRYSGPGYAQIAASDDIDSIDIMGTQTAGQLDILVLGPGKTTLGELTSTAPLRMLNARGVNIDNGSIDVDGSIDFLFLNDLTDADVDFDGTGSNIAFFNNITGETDITVDGGLRLFLANNFTDGSLQADSIGFVLVRGTLDADINVAQSNLDGLLAGRVTGGSIRANGSIGSLHVRQGDMLAEVSAGNAIDQLLLPQTVLAASCLAGTGRAVI